MDNNQSLTLDQRLTMRLSAQQLRFVKLLELTAPELEDAVERELDDNPALEVADEDALPTTRHHAIDLSTAIRRPTIMPTTTSPLPIPTRRFTRRF